MKDETKELLEDSLMKELETGVDLMEKIVEVLVNSEKYRNSQKLLETLDKINKISTSW